VKNIILLIVILFKVTELKSQSITVGGFFGEQSVLFIKDNINTTSKNYSPYGIYSSLIVNSPYGIPYYGRFNMYPNRIGLNYALLKNGFNIGLGGKVVIESNYSNNYYVDFMFRLNTIKLITRNNRSFDISFILNVSNNVEYGLGLSLPLSNNRF
jgi:hypothetical protein